MLYFCDPSVSSKVFLIEGTNNKNTHYGGVHMKLLLTSLALLLIGTTANANWKTDTELGIVLQSGNTQQENTFIKTNATKSVGKNSYNLTGSYINSSGETDGVTSRVAESATAGLKYTRTVSEKLGVLAGVLWEKNRFAGFDDRYSGDVGLRYNIVHSDTGDWSLFNETGYRYRAQYGHIDGSDRGDKVESDFGRVYFETNKQFSKTSRFRFWVEGLYDFSDSDNYEVNFEPSIDVAIGEFLSGDNPAKVSLKLAYTGMFDNVPALDGLKKFDSIVSTTIKVLY